jgi:DNA-binding MarR family transcriptional regulator
MSIVWTSMLVGRYLTRQEQSEAAELDILTQKRKGQITGRRRLEDRVSFLTHRINAKLQQLCNPVIAPYDLDLYSSRIIVALAEKEAMKVGELVDLMALPQSTMSHQLKRLESDGYVLRTRSSTDNRTVVITLTEKGREVAETCNRLSDIILSYVSEELDENEIVLLSNLLQRVFASLPKEVSTPL